MIVHTVNKIALDAEYITTEPVVTVSTGFHINLISIKPFEILLDSGLIISSKEVEINDGDSILRDEVFHMGFSA